MNSAVSVILRRVSGQQPWPSQTDLAPRDLELDLRGLSSVDNDSENRVCEDVLQGSQELAWAGDLIGNAVTFEPSENCSDL